MTAPALVISVPETDTSPRRIAAIDGLRGLSIVLVLLYHCYSRWADLLPWAARYRYFVLCEHGGLGVNLFFIISGFVIFMTLHNCRTFGEFIYRRWLRLFPAMSLATLLMYLSADLLPERPVGTLALKDTIPGLVFIDPGIINRIFPLEVKVIEGAFWSIFVEVKFYLIFGALYFISKDRALSYLSLLFLATWICLNIPSNLAAVHQDLLYALTKILSLHHMGWFLMGALLYQAYNVGSKRSGVLSAFVLPLAVLADSGESAQIFFVCVLLYAVFVATLFNKSFAKLFASRFFLFWGFISYPLYLIHQNILVALTIKTHAVFPDLPGLLTPLPGVGAVVMVSYLLAQYGEPLLKKWIVIILGSRGLGYTNRHRPSKAE